MAFKVQFPLIFLTTLPPTAKINSFSLILCLPVKTFLRIPVMKRLPLLPFNSKSPSWVDHANPRIFSLSFVSSSSFLGRKTNTLRHLHSSSTRLSPPPASLTIRHFSPPTKHYKNPISNVAPPEVPVPQRIAVIGGGLAGLSVIYHLLHSTSKYARKRNFDLSTTHITLFDPSPPGESGASAAAAGLLHEFRPRPKKKIWNHQKGIDAALHLLAVAETNGRKLVSTPGILKLAFDERTVEDFQIAARRFPNEVEYFDPDSVSKRFPQVSSKVPALFIRKGHVVDTVPYMQSLWEICKGSGRVTWNQSSISSVSELFNSSEFDKPFDNVVVCAGAAVKEFIDLSHVPVSRSLGHNLIMQHTDSSSTSPSLSTMPLMSGTYIVPQMTNKNEIIAGPTRNLSHTHFNENDLTESEKLDLVAGDLTKQLERMEPELFKKWHVKSMQSGVRAKPPRSHEGSVPIVCEVQGTPEDRWCWLFTGLGGRGLLYHAFLGRRLAQAIIAGREHLIPGESRKLKISLK